MEQNHSDLIILLANGISQRRMYFDTHPRVVATAGDVTAGLNAAIGAAPEGSFSFGVFNGKFVQDGHYLVGPSIAGRALIDFAVFLGCGGFTFRPPLTADQITAFFRLGAVRGEKPANLAEAQALLTANGIGRIQLAAPYEEDGKPGDAEGAGTQLAQEFAPLLMAYQSMYGAVRANLEIAHDGGSVDLMHARDVAGDVVALAERGVLDVMQFMRYPDFDTYTIGHSVRVAALATMLGRALDWPAWILADVAVAGLLHDVGKSRIPDAVLFKPGRLDADERRLVEAHPSLGVGILLDSGERNPVVISATWGHHLRHDGGGYPWAPAGYRPGAVAAALRVCDVFEALTAARPYKDALAPRQAYDVMLADAAAFHPRILAAFVNLLGLYPPGCVLRLGDGSTAVVVAKGRTLDRPLVRVTADAHGASIARDQQPAIDLQHMPELDVVAVAAVGAMRG